MPNIPEMAITDLTARRLTELAEAKQTTPEKLVVEAVETLTSSPASRSAIRAHRQGRSLADLGWVDGYEGQPVDDILTLADSEDADRLLMSLEQAIEQKWQDDPAARSGTENIVMAVMALIREVNNGGFDQFFRNSSKRWAFFVGDALLHVGRKDAARIAKRALRAIGIPKDIDFRKLFETFDARMNVPNERRASILQECDIQFYNLVGLSESLLAYARQHPDGLLRHWPG